MNDPIALTLRHWMYRQLYELVRDAGEYGITKQELIRRLYAHRADGGPESNCIKVIVCNRINPRIAKHGVKIQCGRGHSYYRLLKT